MTGGARPRGAARPALPWRRVWWLLAWLAAAALLWHAAWPSQHKRACWMGEWPFEQGCASLPRGSDVANPPQVYRQHLARNPGDARAWVWLTESLFKDDEAQALQLLQRTAQLAPHHTSTLALRAATQLQAQQWDSAVDTLITLMERGQAQARPALLQLMLAPETQPLVLQRLSSESEWLDLFLATLPANAPVGALQPFIGAGMESRLLKPRTVLTLVDRLKQGGAWFEAYALWVQWRGEQAGLLFNGSFDSPSLKRGFDWFWTNPPASRQGFLAEQVPASPQAGWMLEVRLTGRGALPASMVSQTLVLPGPAYRLRGRYMTDRMLTKEGLVWALRCAGGGERWAQTVPILDTQRRWNTFELELSPPASCGATVELRLETAAPWEARAGMAGTAYFDDFTLETLGAAEPDDTPRTAASSSRRAPP